jgi:hypothetical protein
MQYNNLSGCNDICMKNTPHNIPQIYTWEIEDCKTCIRIKGTLGSFDNKNLCEGALAILNKYSKSCRQCEPSVDRFDCVNGTCVPHEKGQYSSYGECSTACHVFSCKLGRGCIPDYKGGQYSHVDCLKACTLWDCNTNECVVTNDGNYKSFNDCHVEASCYGYSCLPGQGCVKVPKGEYSTEVECIRDCTNATHSSTFSDCCELDPKGLYTSTAQCLQDNFGYDCTDGCEKSHCGGPYKTKDSCIKGCKPWKCTLGSGCTKIVGKGDYASESECITGCKEYECTPGSGCSLNIKGTKHLRECKDSCTFWGCDTGCMTKTVKGIFVDVHNCNKACTPWKCTPTGCIHVTDGSGTFETADACKLSCLSFNCDTGGCIQQDGTGGTYTSNSLCELSCTSWNCGADGCIEVKGNGGTYDTKGECESSCKPWECTQTLGCKLAQDYKGSYKTKAECNSDCGYKCNPNLGCIHQKGGPYKGLDDCMDKCENYECISNTCTKTQYGQHESQVECEKSCKAPVNHVKYPKKANGIWFIGDNYTFDPFVTMSKVDMDSQYGWIKHDKINVVSLSFANPYHILTKGGTGADSDGLPLGMKEVINYLHEDNVDSDGEQKRVVMISVGGWNNSVCSTSGNSCPQTPCNKCSADSKCNCDTSFALGPCKDISGYCSGNSCCAITSYAGPWPAIPKGNIKYQELIPTEETYAAPGFKKQSIDNFGGVKICAAAADIDGCKADSCTDNWYKSFTTSVDSATTLGKHFGEIAIKYGVGIEIDYEPQCGWGKCVYCNDQPEYPCSKEADDGTTYQCEHSSSTAPFMQQVVNNYNSVIGGKYTEVNDKYQNGPLNPLTIDCGGGAWWLTDIFDFVSNNIHGINYLQKGDPVKNSMTIANIMVDSLPIGSMNKAISCSPDMVDNCLANRGCDYAALTAAWLWAPHFIAKGDRLDTLNNIKSCHGYGVQDLKDLEGKKVLHADNPILKGFYQTPGVPSNFKLLESERTSISLFCNNGPSLDSSWDVYDKLGCGNTPDIVPPTIDVLFNALSKDIGGGNRLFYPGETNNPHGSTGRVGGIMYWGAGRSNQQKMLGAAHSKGGQDICQTFKASYDVLNGTTEHICTEPCNSCNTVHALSCDCDNACISRHWQSYESKIPKGVEIITYACGTGTCGDWALKGVRSDLDLLNGCTQIINPWVTTIDQFDCRTEPEVPLTTEQKEAADLSSNTCYTKSDMICQPNIMNTYIKAQHSCIKKWGGKTILSLGGWAEGYTFSQAKMKKENKGYKPDAEGPINYVYPCFNSSEPICQDHPSTKLLPGSENWGYWCFKGDSIDTTKSGSSQGGVGCDGGPGDSPAQDCWNWLTVPGMMENHFIKYAVDNNYDGIDVDYEPNGSVGNQPYNTWYMYTASTLANQKSLDITMAPLQNFFLDNANWDYVPYTGTEYSTFKHDGQKGYKCEGPGGYGNMLFTLYKENVNLHSIFIQFYNNPPSVCDATKGNENYCVTTGSLGTIENYGPDATSMNIKAGVGGKYYTLGPGCGGGTVDKGDKNDFKLLQCAYEGEEDTWGWKKAGYRYTGMDNPNLAASFCGDPLGYYTKGDNTWLTTKRVDDEPWMITSLSGLNKTTTIQMGGIKNTLMVMLLAKAYQPNAIIAYGTVPPGGGNCSNLSSNMVLDLFKHIFNLESEIKKDLCNSGKSQLLCTLMNELYNNGRLHIDGMDDAYWGEWWGGTPGTKKFCTKYPGYDKGKFLFGGLGAWSTYWTEEHEGGAGNKTWIQNIKEFFNAHEATSAELDACYNSGPAPTHSPSNKVGYCVYKNSNGYDIPKCDEMCNSSSECTGNNPQGCWRIKGDSGYSTYCDKVTTSKCSGGTNCNLLGQCPGPDGSPGKIWPSSNTQQKYCGDGCTICD